MKRGVISLLLVSMLIVGCGQQNTQTNNVVNETTTEITEVDDKVTATALLNDWLVKMKSGYQADVNTNEEISVDIKRNKKVYNTLLNVSSKGTFNMKNDLVTSYYDALVRHYYTYNTNYADVYKFATKEKVKDSNDLINKNAGETVQTVIDYTGSDARVIQVDDKVGSKTQKQNQLPLVVFSDFTNLNFKEVSNGYIVTGTISDKLFGNLFNMEDLYIDSLIDTSNCTYNVEFAFTKNKILQKLTITLVKGVGNYSKSKLLKTIDGVYLNKFDVVMENFSYNIDTLGYEEPKTNTKNNKFVKYCNQY